MKTRIVSLLLIFIITQSMMAQLISLGLVEESNVENKKNEIKRGYSYFIPELKFGEDNSLYAGTPTGLYKCNLSNPEDIEWEKLPITDDVIEDFEVRGDTVIVLSRKELLLSINGGMTAIRRFSDTVFLDSAYIRELHNIAVYPNDAKRLYVAHGISYLSHTDDFGLSWSKISDTGLTDLYYSPHNPMNLVGYSNNKMYDATGAYVSTDGGLNWEYARRISGAIGETYRIAFHPTDSNKLVACGDGVYALSDDGGASWSRIYLPGHEQYQRPTACLFDVVYDTRNPNTLYGANMYTGFELDTDTMKVVRSTDGGITWSEFFVAPMSNKGNLLRMDVKDNLLALYTSANGIYLLDVDAVETSISTTENGKSMATPYYDLQGRPVVNPARGIYIKDGKKIAVD